MRIRLTQIDGALPNLALMKIAKVHRDRGDEIHFTRRVRRDMIELEYDRVYGSAIFSYSAEHVRLLGEEFPGAIVGGTWDRGIGTVEDILPEAQERFDYSIYPDFTGSIGFTQRGCRLKCGFCVVPKKEGKPRSVASVAEIWRGGEHPKHVHLLDNDFFGQPREQWQERIREIRDGGFKVCLNQGINTRMIDDESAQALASVKYYDDQFKTRRLYTAWDNVGDEARFFAGVETLRRHGIPPTHLLVYMLIGYDKRETWERIFYRFEKMVALGIRPYPMVYGEKHRGLELGACNKPIERRTLAEFQRWVIRKAYTFIPFEHYDVNAKGARVVHPDLFVERV